MSKADRKAAARARKAEAEAARAEELAELDCTASAEAAKATAKAAVLASLPPVAAVEAPTAAAAAARGVDTGSPGATPREVRTFTPDPQTTTAHEASAERQFERRLAGLLAELEPPPGGGGLAAATVQLAARHGLCGTEVVQLGFAAAMHGAACGKDVNARLRRHYPQLERICFAAAAASQPAAAEEAAHAVQAALLAGVERLAVQGGLAGGSKGAARWMQLLYNEGDLLDDAGVAAWWAGRRGAAAARNDGGGGGADFEAEAMKFAEWVADADSDSEDEGSDGN